MTVMFPSGEKLLKTERKKCKNTQDMCPYRLSSMSLKADVDRSCLITSLITDSMAYWLGNKVHPPIMTKLNEKIQRYEKHITWWMCLYVIYFSNSICKEEHPFIS